MCIIQFFLDPDNHFNTPMSSLTKHLGKNEILYHLVQGKRKWLFVLKGLNYEKIIYSLVNLKV